MGGWLTPTPIARIAAIAFISAGVTACQPGTGGTLEPAAGQQTGAAGPYGGGSVRLVANGIDVQVSGNWRTSLGANTLDVQVTYHNSSKREVSLNAAEFGTRRGRDGGEVTQVVDMTGVNLADDRADNDDATQVMNIYEGRRRGTIRLAAGQSRNIEVSTSLPEGAAPLEERQGVWVLIPTEGGTAEAHFTTDSSWF